MAPAASKSAPGYGLPATALVACCSSGCCTCSHVSLSTLVSRGTLNTVCIHSHFSRARKHVTHGTFLYENNRLLILPKKFKRKLKIETRRDYQIFHIFNKALTAASVLFKEEANSCVQVGDSWMPRSQGLHRKSRRECLTEICQLTGFKNAVMNGIVPLFWWGKNPTLLVIHQPDSNACRRAAWIVAAPWIMKCR